MLAAGVATVLTWFAFRWVVLNAPVRPGVVEAIPALFAVVMEAYLDGVSTRKVDDLVKTRLVAAKKDPPSPTSMSTSSYG